MMIGNNNDHQVCYLSLFIINLIINHELKELLTIAAATQISFLFGKGRSDEAAQVVTDLIRMSFVCGAFTAAVLIPIIRPISVWLGAEEKIIQLCI